MLKYNKKRSWDSILVAKTSEILSDTLLLVDVSKTSLGKNPGCESATNILFNPDLGISITEESWIVSYPYEKWASTVLCEIGYLPYLPNDEREARMFYKFFFYF